MLFFLIIIFKMLYHSIIFGVNLHQLGYNSYWSYIDNDLALHTNNICADSESEGHARSYLGVIWRWSFHKLHKGARYKR